MRHPKLIIAGIGLATLTAALGATAAEMPPAAARATPRPAMTIFGCRMLAPHEIAVGGQPTWKRAGDRSSFTFNY